MRRSSSPADGNSPEPTLGLFDAVLARGAVRAAVSDAAWLAAMLQAEAALARAQAHIGLLPESTAATITSFAQPERFDLAAIAAAAAGPGNPVLPLVRALRAQLPEAAARAVHVGATSQDILDTASMLVADRALGHLLDDLAGAADAAAGLARAYRSSPMAGRTLLQHALPTTFGLKAAGWLAGLRQATGALARVRRERLAVQLGGGAGTLDAWGADGPRLVDAYAAEIGLAAPVLPWHTDRTRVAELAGALAVAAGAAGKVARDVTLLAQSEVAEVSEATPGGSSAMAHKRNPVAAIATLAAAASAPGLAGTLYAAQVQEHERAAGAWHAEWRPLRELLVSTGSAAAWLRTCLTGLVVNEAAMRRNLAALATGAGVDAAGVGAAEALVDRALAAYDGEGMAG